MEADMNEIEGFVSLGDLMTETATILETLGQQNQHAEALMGSSSLSSVRFSTAADATSSTRSKLPFSSEQISAGEPHTHSDVTNSNEQLQTPPKVGHGLSDACKKQAWSVSPVPVELKLMKSEFNDADLVRLVEEFWQEAETIRASAWNFQVPTAEKVSEKRETRVQKSSSHHRGDSAPSTDDSQPTETSGDAADRSSIIPATSLGSEYENRSDGKSSISGWKKAIHLGRAISTGWKRMLRQDKPLAVSREPLRKALTKECSSCFDDMPKSSAIDLECQHNYCSECFLQLVSTSMQNENYWPPRCCLQEIPRNKILRNLSHEQVIEFGAKESEYSTPAKDRWYCTRPSCLKCFKPIDHHSWVQCPFCSFRMCKFCRAKLHNRGDRCPQDEALQATLAEAELEGWRACYNCKTMVELARGCRHITCKCGAHFW